MGHELSFVGGKAEMFYVASEGQPWHGHGTPVDQALTAEEALHASGLAAPVWSLPVFAQAPDGTMIPIPDRRANVRSDNRDVLEVVSDHYRIIQASEQFSILDALTGEAGGLRYHTAGAFGKGERQWILATLPGAVRIKGTDDVLGKYILAYNSHNGTSKFRILPTAIRVVCWNTASAALRRGQDDGIAIGHWGDPAAKIDEARRVLGLASDYFDAFGEGADLLASISPDTDTVRRYFEAALPAEDKSEAAISKAKRNHLALIGLFEAGRGQDMKGIKGTLWAAYNAVTEFADHHSRKASNRRLRDNWIGTGAATKRHAWDLAIQLATKPHAELMPAVIAPEPDSVYDEPGGGVTVGGVGTIPVRAPGRRGRPPKVTTGVN